MENLPVKLLDKNAELPVCTTDGSAGYDLIACTSGSVIIDPGCTRLIGTGFAMALPKGYAGFIFARSGLGIKHGIVPGNCVGVVDSDYRGEVKVGLRNNSNESFIVNKGDRIAQIVIIKCETPELVLCDDLDDTIRGDGGFGSTG